MKLTKEEQALILKRRQEKEAQEIPCKTGILKEDLFQVTDYNYMDSVPFDAISVKEKEDIIKDFASNFEIICPAETKFNCFIEDGHEI